MNATPQVPDPKPPTSEEGLRQQVAALTAECEALRIEVDQLKKCSHCKHCGKHL